MSIDKTLLPFSPELRDKIAAYIAERYGEKPGITDIRQAETILAIVADYQPTEQSDGLPGMCCEPEPDCPAKYRHYGTEQSEDGVLERAKQVYATNRDGDSDVAQAYLKAVRWILFEDDPDAEEAFNRDNCTIHEHAIQAKDDKCDCTTVLILRADCPYVASHPNAKREVTDELLSRVCERFGAYHSMGDPDELDLKAMRELLGEALNG